MKKQKRAISVICIVGMLGSMVACGENKENVIINDNTYVNTFDDEYETEEETTEGEMGQYHELQKIYDEAINKLRNNKEENALELFLGALEYIDDQGITDEKIITKINTCVASAYYALDNVPKYIEYCAISDKAWMKAEAASSYWYGIHVEKDLEKALQLFGEAEAMSEISYMDRIEQIEKELEETNKLEKPTQQTTQKTTQKPTTEKNTEKNAEEEKTTINISDFSDIEGSRDAATVNGSSIDISEFPDIDWSEDFNVEPETKQVISTDRTTEIGLVGAYLTQASTGKIDKSLFHSNQHTYLSNLSASSKTMKELGFISGYTYELISIIMYEPGVYLDWKYSYGLDEYERYGVPELKENEIHKDIDWMSYFNLYRVNSGCAAVFTIKVNGVTKNCHIEYIYVEEGGKYYMVDAKIDYKN